MTMNDNHGCTLCTDPGDERFEYFTTSTRPRRKLCQYDYRHPGGELFSCVKPTLDACRAARDEWIKKQSIS